MKGRVTERGTAALQRDHERGRAGGDRQGGRGWAAGAGPAVVEEIEEGRVTAAAAGQAGVPQRHSDRPLLEAQRLSTQLIRSG